MGLHLCSLRNLSSFYDSLNSSPGILTESDFSLSYSSPCQPKESDLSLACHFQNRSPELYVIILWITNKAVSVMIQVSMASEKGDHACLLFLVCMMT